MKVGLYSASYFHNWNRDGGLAVEEARRLIPALSNRRLGPPAG